MEWLLYYRRCLFSVLELDERYDWWVMEPNMHHSLFPISHLCVLTYITWKLQVVYGCSAYQTTALLLETFFVWLRVDWRATAPDMHRSFSDTTFCVYTANTYTHRYLVWNYAWQQNSHTLWLHTTDQTTALLPMMHRFISKNLAIYTTHVHIAVCFQLIVYANTKITKRYIYTTVRLNEFAAKQQKMNINLG